MQKSSSKQISTTFFVSSRMLAEVGQFIKEKGLINSSDRVLCMVSGGADSVAMLHLLYFLSQGSLPAFSPSFTLGICHVNYGLRGEASQRDEEFVRALGQRLGLDVHVISAPSEKRSNFQAWARDFRYLAAQSLCRSHGYNKIAVGHNKDDRVETLIYRLITYSGRRSLAVMPPSRGMVVRPLLALSAAQVRGYCAETGIAYREDESNQTLDYVRNQVRQTVIPPLEEIRPDFRDRVLDTLALLEDEDEILAAATAAAWQQVVDAADPACLRADAVARLPRATARLVVRRWLSGASSRVRLSRRVLDAAVDLCRHSHGSQSLSLADGLRLERRYDKLRLHLSAGRNENLIPDSVILPVPGVISFGDFEIEAFELNGLLTPGELASGGELEAVVDAARLHPPLVVRSWRAGDRFKPLGLGGTKTVQDLFIDAKIPKAVRELTPIVTSGKEIIWICGVRMAEDFKVTSRSERLIRLKATRRIVDHSV